MFNWKLFPHTSFSEINLDWICDILKALTGGTTGQYLKKKSDDDFDFEWSAGGGGGGGTSDYNDLSNKPQINSVTLSGNKTLTQLGITAAALGAYVKPGTGIPKTDLASGVQTSLGKADTAYQKPGTGIPKTDLASAVQTSLGKADTALQSAPVSSVNTKTGAVTLSASDVGAIAAPVGPTTDYFLKWNGSAWVASALPLYSGGVG